MNPRTTIARRKRLHAGPVLFMLVVIVPLVIIGSYLYGVAQDQYDSRASFSIRSQQGGGAAAQNFLGILSTVSSSGSAQDLDILKDYIRSQAMVDRLASRIDLSAIFAQRGNDRVFSLPADASTEDLLAYWRRMVRVSSEARDGILHLEVKAFDAQNAQLLAREILAASSDLINQLSDQARADNIRLSSELVIEARAEVQKVLEQLTEFRRKHQIVSPDLEVQASSGVLTALQTQLAEALVSREQLTGLSTANDPRVQNLDNRIEALRTQIDAERANLSRGDMAANVDIYGRYQSLLLDQEMMNGAYAQALADLAVAHAESRRQARYVAVHIPPTLADTPQYPQKIRILVTAGMILVLIWAILMIFYRNARSKLQL